ncbi:probable disease resistance protein At1g58602 [Quercus lobata]|uniref:NB-ARC domain-containing protein n=1 Tax=Quercus lobata TaxID=97700 RepID=A0A7N2LLH2_QUELO|nr:probable disease resistance protein At1g58602 [Quercus lobata]
MGILSVISKLSHAYVLDLYIILIILVCGDLITILLSYIFWHQVGKRYRRLKRNIKLLDGVVKDVEEVSEAGRKLDEQPNQLRDSQLKAGVTVQLADIERDWVDATKAMVRRVQDCQDFYQKLGERRKPLKLTYSAVMDWKKIHRLKADLDSCQWEMYQIWERRIQICKSIEQSMSIVRSLQSRPITEHKSHPYKRAPPTVSIERNLKVLFANNPELMSDSDKQKEIEYLIKFPVQLLHSFLRDLEGLKLESQTEKAWVEAAEEIFGQLQHEIDGVQKKANLVRWLPFLGNWMTRRWVKNSFGQINKQLWSLFIKKYTIDFSFIKRVPSKSVGPSPKKKTQAPTDDKEILDLLDEFNKQLNREQSKMSSWLKQLLEDFKQVHQLLKDAKAVEGLNNSRILAWKDQIKFIVKDAISSLSSSQPQRSNTSTQKEIDPWKKSSTEFERFEQAMEFLAISMEVCRIKLSEETNSVVGLEDNTHEMVSLLTTNDTNEHCSTLSIVGMMGIGKTTLAQKVFEHAAIQKHFEFRYWVPLPDIGDDKHVLLKILGETVLANQGERTENDYSFKGVNDFLKGRKYLVVLDKISSKQTWDTLKEAFRDKISESKILLTTRDKSVALHVDLTSIMYPLKLRTQEESWDLFKQMVRFQAEPSRPDHGLSPEFKKLAEKVVGRCGGLPSSILNHGYLLSGKEVTSKDLSRVLEHVTPNQIPWSENLETNAKDLPQNLSQCLSYFGQFPKDTKISSRRLVVLWVAEGLVEQSGDKQEPLKSVAEKYLSELIKRNLVQEVERKLNGRVKTCSFPSALRELWLRENPSSGFDQHVLYYTIEKDSSFGGNINSSTPNILQSYRNPLSMLCFDTHEGDKPGEAFGDYLKKGIASGHLLHLKVLDLEHVFRPQLPKSIGKLIQLTYLGLRWTYLENIPSSIGNLVNLETLDVKHTYIRTLPSSIWKLKKLQNLYMSEIYRSKIEHQPERKCKCNQRNKKFLQNLQILRGAFVDKESPLKDAFNMMKNLQILDLSFQLEWSQQKALAESLVELKHLQKLTLKSFDEMGQPQDLYVTQLSGLVDLHYLSLYGKLKNPSIVITINGLPQSLTELTLSASRLSNDPMPELEKLHNLKSLCLYSASYTGKQMVCSSGGFPQLKILKLWMLQELEEWKMKEQAMPSLKQVEIRSCKKLKVPDTTDLRHLKTLRELKLKNMPVDFSKTIENNKDQIWGHVAVFPVIINE